MAKKPSINNITTGYTSAEAINENFQNVRDAFDNTLSLDGSTPNAMNADLDMNGNSIINADTILVGGQDYLAQALAAKTAAQAAQTGAETAETNAEDAEAAALVSETNAAASAAAALSSETHAASSEGAAAASASSASTSASSASTSASAASSSASAAASSASDADDSATAAASSASAASSSASSAASSASSASASADAALAALDNFDDRYLGQKASDPTLDNDGNALIAGALYFNTTDNSMKVYDGSQWLAAYASLSGALLAANNLSDLADAATARTNLGLGSAATTDSTDYATAAQGTNADTAYGWGDHASAGYLTDITGESIQDLSDVSAMTPTEGQALVYSSGSWTAADMSGGIAYTRKTANYTASANEGIIADTSGGSFTVTLPANPATGDTVMVVDGNDWSTTNLIVGRNGSTIEGDAEDMTMDIGGASVQFTYDGTTWQIYTQVGTTSSDFNLDGGFAASVYTPEQTIDGGSA